MSLYKYLTSESLLRVLDGTIRFTQPKAFNDPFELLPEFFTPDDCEHNLSFDFDLCAPRRTPRIGELENDFTSDNCNDVNSRKILSELNKSIGILCLSKNSSSLLMWSHYADEYSGAVIEFDESHQFFTGIFNVEYRESRPKKDIRCYLQKGLKIPIAEFCTKSKVWEYESEYRIVRSLKDCRKVNELKGHPIYVQDIPLDTIKSVTLGERMPISTQRAIWETLKDTQISLYLAAISNWGYDFRRDPIKFDKPVSEINPMINPRTAHIFSESNSPFGETARWMIENHESSGFLNDTL